MAAHIACVNHADRPALFECRRCHTHVCKDCTKHLWVDDKFCDLCPKCDTELVVLAGVVEQQQRSAEIPDPGPVSYANRIPEFMTFVFNPSVLFMVVGLAILTAPLYWAVRNNIFPPLIWIGLMIIRGLEVSVYFRFVEKTAYGEKDIGPPDITDVDDIFAPLFRYVVALLPVIVAILWFSSEHYNSLFWGFFLFELDPWKILDYTGPALLFFVGLALMPLLTMIAALSGTAGGVLNPATWAHALRVFGSTYIVATIAFYALIAFEYLGLAPILIRFRQDVDIPVLTSIVTLVIAYLAMAVRARVLGGLGEPYLRDFER